MNKTTADTLGLWALFLFSQFALIHSYGWTVAFWNMTGWFILFSVAIGVKESV